MREKKVWRYYCDFCKKAGCSKYHLKRHEERCTLNPNRYCGICGFLEQTQCDIAEVKKLLPNPDDFSIDESDEFGTRTYFNSDRLTEAMEELMPDLRRETNECPACMLAVLRQGGIPVDFAKGFNFTEECKSAWKEFNSRQDYY